MDRRAVAGAVVTDGERLAEGLDFEGLDLRPHFSLDSSVCFLNHGSFGAVPRRIQHYQSEVRAQMEAEPVRFFTRELPVLMGRVRGEFAEFLGGEPGRLAFVTNTTEGVNAVLRSLDLEEGDELLITDQGYGACNNACRFVAERAGASVVVAKLPRRDYTPADLAEAIVSRVTAKTRLALVDHVTSPTGQVLPIQEIVDALKEKGVETLVDGAHGPGQVPVALDELGAAYYTGNAHKWLCAPRGAAFLYVREDLLETVRPLAISHGATMDTARRSRFLNEFDWTGTKDPTAWLCVPEAIRFVASLYPGGWAGVRERSRSLALEARELLGELPGVSPVGPEECVGSMASFEIPLGEGLLASSVVEGDPLQDRLFDEYGVQVPVFPLHDPPWRALRVSLHVYNRRRDLEVLREALEAALGSSVR